MKLLLDTHVWLWMVSSSSKLSASARKLLGDPDTTLYLSAASAWEIAIKYHLGKLPLPEHPRDFIEPRLVRDRVSPLPVDHAHAVEVAGLPDHHTDPFDRLLVAQARVERMTLATVDPNVVKYDAEFLWAG